MQKEHLKSNGTKERQDITKRKDHKIKSENGMKVENFKSDRDQGYKGKKLKYRDSQVKLRHRKKERKSKSSKERYEIIKK